MFILLVDHDDYRCVVTEAGNQFKPMTQTAFLFTSASIYNNEIKAAAGEEELMSSLINTLATKVPEIKGNGSRSEN